MTIKKNIDTFEYGFSKISYYATDGLEDASGDFNKLVVGEIQSIITEEVIKQERIVIYPTVTDGQINIKAIDNTIYEATIFIYDVSGRIIYEDKECYLPKNKSTNIDLSMLSNGIYIIIINSGTNSYSTKFIKK